MLKLKCLTVTALAAIAFCSTDLTAQDKFVRASQVTGMEIRNADNQPAGKIEDVILDKDSGTIAFAIVSFTPALNAGDKLFAVPWTSLKTAADKGFVLDTPKERLEKAPAFDRNAWPEMTAKWTSEVQSFFGAAPARLSNEAVKNPALPPDALRPRMGEDGHRDGTSVTGRVKYFKQGDPAQVVITTDNGEVWADLAPSAYLDQQRLVFSSNDEVTFRGTETTRDGRRFFVVNEVTTRDGRTFRMRDELTGEKTIGIGERNLDRPAAVAITPESIRDLTGTVTYIEGTGCGESVEGRLVTIRTDRGERVVALGPGSYLLRQRFDVRQNDQLVIRGYEADHNGRRFFYATEVRRGDEVLKLRRDDGTPLW
jgi:sporulation protein YlmC with PRC-barrel domain